MNLTSCKVSSTSYTSSAKSCIAVLLGSCFCLLPFSARSEVSQSSVDDIADWLSTINAQLGIMKDVQGHMWENLRGIHSRSSNIENHVIDLKAYAANEEKYLKFYSNRLANLQFGGDGLNGNPWWATNSMFGTFNGWRGGNGAAGTDYMSQIFPDYPDGNPPVAMSFPQFMSLWGMRLNGAAPRPNASAAPGSRNFVNYWNDWGFAALTNVTMSQSQRALRGYTWFDMIADMWKSNLTLQASIAREGWTNDFENSAWVLNHFDYAMGDVTNLLGSMVGASDPWWSTNSAFAMTYPALGLVAPQLLPGNGSGQPGIQSYTSKGMSFPEYMSFRAAMENRGASDAYGQASQESLVWFGADDFEHWSDALNFQRQATFTFEDWLATMLRTTLVLTMGTYANSYSNLIADAAAHGYADYSQPTNVPLPEYEDLVSEAQSEAASSEMSSAEEKMSEVVTALSGMIQTPNSEITVIPEFTVGGIHVSEQKFDFDNTVATVGRRIMNFVWYVALFASMFALLESEWAYYVNLGRTWTTSGGFLKSRGGP